MKDKTAGSPEFILVAEDDRGANTLEASRLEPLGMELRSAYTAKEVREILKNAQPKLMLLDYSLPDMSALELLAELRKENVPVPPFIVITGFGDEKLAVEIMKFGAEDYIVKDSALLDSLLDRAKKALASAGLKGELAKTLAKLRESETRYIAILDLIEDGVFSVDADGGGLIVNKSFAAMHGYKDPEEMSGMKLTDLDTPKTAPLVPERLRRVLAGEKLTFEVEHFHKDGHALRLSVTTGAVKVGGKTYIQAVHRDIRKK